VKVGDMARLRKSNPAVKRWRRNYRKFGSPHIGRWAEEGELLLLLGECDYSSGRWEVLGPGGQLASFDDYLMTTRGMTK